MTSDNSHTDGQDGHDSDVRAGSTADAGAATECRGVVEAGHSCTTRRRRQITTKLATNSAATSLAMTCVGPWKPLATCCHFAPSAYPINASAAVHGKHPATV